MKTVDRGKKFSGYWLSDDGEVLFGVKPYHSYKQGVVNGRVLLFCIFFEDLLNDDPKGLHQESADMCPSAADSRMTDDTLLKQDYLLCPEYAGKTFGDVCARYPVQYTKIVDKEGNTTQFPNAWKNSQEVP